MRREQARSVRVPERPEPLSLGGAPSIDAVRPWGRRRRPWHCQFGWHHTSDRAGTAPYSSRRRIRSVALLASGESPTMGSDRRPDRCRVDGPTGHPFAYPVLSIDRGGEVPPAVHEPRSTPYRAKSVPPPAPVVRATQSRPPPGPSRSRIGCISSRGRRGPGSSSRSTVSASSVCVIATIPPGGSASRPRRSSSANGTGSRPRPGLPTTRSSASASPSRRWTSGNG